MPPRPMAAARICFSVFAFFVLGARFWTGIVYEHDDPTTYLVLKHRPSLVIEQENGEAPVRERFVILDGDENDLAYQGGYVFIMRWAFAIAAACIVIALCCRRVRSAHP